MRNEIFQQIRQNKRQFYQEINQVTSSPFTEKPIIASYEIKEETQSVVKALINSFERLKQCNLFKEQRLLGLKTGIKSFSKSFGPLSIPQIPFLSGLHRIASSNIRDIREKSASKLNRLEDQVLYFILVFFGEESTMEFASPAIRNHLHIFSRFTVNRSLSFLITFKQFENRFSTQTWKQSKMLKHFQKSTFNQGLVAKIMTLSKACNSLKNRFIGSVNIFIDLLHHIPILNRLSFVKRL